MFETVHLVDKNETYFTVCRPPWSRERRERNKDVERKKMRKGTSYEFEGGGQSRGELVL
jgi:hypothetical protein